jgi:hypothetical protein
MRLVAAPAGTLAMLPLPLLILAAAAVAVVAAAAATTTSRYQHRVQSGCNFFGTAGTDYADANLSVVQLNGTRPLASCCAACDAWNRELAVGVTQSQRCSFGVVLRGGGGNDDGSSSTITCTLKPSATQPFSAAHATAVRPEQGPGGQANLDLIVLPPRLAERYGAKCLDGSPPALYYKKAANPSASRHWVLFFKGGGWCCTRCHLCP